MFINLLNDYVKLVKILIMNPSKFLAILKIILSECEESDAAQIQEIFDSFRNYFKKFETETEEMRVIAKQVASRPFLLRQFTRLCHKARYF